MKFHFWMSQGKTLYQSEDIDPKIGTIQRRLAWPLRKDDTQNREAFHIFFAYFLPFLSFSYDLQVSFDNKKLSDRVLNPYKSSCNFSNTCCHTLHTCWHRHIANILITWTIFWYLNVLMYNLKPRTDQTET